MLYKSTKYEKNLKFENFEFQIFRTLNIVGYTFVPSITFFDVFYIFSAIFPTLVFYSLTFGLLYLLKLNLGVVSGVKGQAPKSHLSLYSH